MAHEVGRVSEPWIGVHLTHGQSELVVVAEAEVAGSNAEVPVRTCYERCAHADQEWASPAGSSWSGATLKDVAPTVWSVLAAAIAFGPRAHFRSAVLSLALSVGFAFGAGVHPATAKGRPKVEAGQAGAGTQSAEVSSGPRSPLKSGDDLDAPALLDDWTAARHGGSLAAIPREVLVRIRGDKFPIAYLKKWTKVTGERYVARVDGGFGERPLLLVLDPKTGRIRTIQVVGARLDASGARAHMPVLSAPSDGRAGLPERLASGGSCLVDMHRELQSFSDRDYRGFVRFAETFDLSKYLEEDDPTCSPSWVPPEPPIVQDPPGAGSSEQTAATDGNDDEDDEDEIKTDCPSPTRAERLHHVLSVLQNGVSAAVGRARMRNQASSLNERKLSEKVYEPLARMLSNLLPQLLRDDVISSLGGSEREMLYSNINALFQDLPGSYQVQLDPYLQGTADETLRANAFAGVLSQQAATDLSTDESAIARARAYFVSRCYPMSSPQREDASVNEPSGAASAPEPSFPTPAESLRDLCNTIEGLTPPEDLGGEPATEDSGNDREEK